VSLTVNRQVLSVGQDILYTASSGQSKTPKHIRLATAVKSMTGSSQLVTLLNRFGHAISYTKLEEMETAIAERQIFQQQSGTFQPNIFTVWCWDNNGILEETLSGADTIHCTNGIIIQRQPDTCLNKPEVNRCRTVTDGNRSLTAPPLDLERYTVGKKCNPAPMQIPAEKLQAADQEITTPQLLDFAWFLLRLEIQDTVLKPNENPEHLIPAWSGFNAKLKHDVPRRCIIGYCPVIDASPTELTVVVYNILKRSQHMAHQLGQKDVMSVFD